MKANDAPLLLDVSRLIWRRWTGTRPTGIDRVCLAWLEHYASLAQAVVVHKRGRSILPYATSQSLFRLLKMPERPERDTLHFRATLLRLVLRRGFDLCNQLGGRGRFWLNPGHTGLDAPGLAEWVRQRYVRPIYLIHDLIPITHPHYCRPGEDLRHHRRICAALDTAAGVVVNSAHTLTTLQEFAIAEGRCLPPARVAWPGTEALTRVPKKAAAAPTFVVLGTIEARKNHAFLLRVWRRLISTQPANAGLPRLVIVGRRGWEADEVFAQLDSGEFGDFVVEAGSIDDWCLADVLACSRAMLFPSHAEGYGIPLAEALASGLPVIASNLEVFHEIGQGVPELLPLDDIDLWCEVLMDYASESSPRREAQLKRIGGFRVSRWSEHFVRVDDLLAQLQLDCPPPLH